MGSQKLANVKGLYLEGIRDGKAREAVARYTGDRYTQHSTGEAQWVTADIFDTDERDRIVEHWDVIQAFEPKTASGRSTIDGATDVVDLDQTDANKKIVAALFDEVLLGGNIGKLGDFISTEHYAQHSPQMADGLTGINRFLFDSSTSGDYPHYHKCHRLIGQGDFVVTLSEQKTVSQDLAVIDIFRLDGEKLVEHWDVCEPILPREAWGNSGKF